MRLLIAFVAVLHDLRTFDGSRKTQLMIYQMIRTHERNRIQKQTRNKKEIPIRAHYDSPKLIIVLNISGLILVARPSTDSGGEIRSIS